MKKLLIGLAVILVITGAFVFYRYKNPVAPNADDQTIKKSDEISGIINNHKTIISSIEKNFVSIDDDFSSFTTIRDSTINPGCLSSSDKVYFRFDINANGSIGDLVLVIINNDEVYTKFITFNIDGSNPSALPTERDFEGDCEWVFLAKTYDDIFQKLGSATNVKLRLTGTKTTVIDLSEKEVSALNRTYQYYSSLKTIKERNEELETELKKESKDGEKLILY